ncbi:MAG: tetratricopeptide repeat protein, partial [Nitrospirae bacterium]|nr:tetratricopeptide repeat protein [Nitrospirota bacterium]
YHYYSGLVALRIKKFRVAEKAFESALRLEPANPEYMAQLGYVYMGLGFPTRAKSAFEKALNISPTCDSALRGLMLV